MPAPGYGLTKAVGPFPLWDADDILGGFHPVLTLADRDAIPFLSRRIPMWCWVMGGTGAGLYYCTDVGSASVAATWASLSFGAGAPSGTGFVKAASNVFSVVSSIVSTDVSDFATAVTARIAATAPTGTGFTHYVSGVRDAAAKLIDLAADVSGNLPAASVSGLTTAINAVIAAYTSLTASQVSDFATAVTARIAATAPTGNGFARYVAGVRNAAAQLIDLANDINPATMLPGANGGGVASVVKQFTTTDATPTSVTETATTLTAWQAGDFIATVIARTGTGAMYRAEIVATYQANAGGPVVLTQVNPPTPNNVFGALTGVVVTYVVSAGVVTLQVTGIAATTIYWDVVQLARVV